MNRAERRKCKNATELIRKEKQSMQNEIDLMIDQACRETLNDTVRDYSAAVLYTAYNKLGFGKKRLQRFATQIQDLFDQIHDDHCSIDDIKQILKDKHNIELG